MTDVEKWWAANHDIGNCHLTAIGMDCTIENHSIDDSKFSWIAFMADMIQPFLDDMKAIHENLPMNSHVPICDVNSGTILTQRQALQTIIMNATTMIESPYFQAGELPTSITGLLELEWI